nr:retrovirus-related Pol polyprotein from transposon TNT 1-94 [Tanacetum cinerariifolium]
MVGGNGGNQFRQHVGQNVRNLNGYNNIQNVGNRVIQHAVKNPRIQNAGNQNGLIGVLWNANQNPNGNGNLVATRAEDLDEIEEVNANFILMANLQHTSTSGTQTDKAPVYDSNGSAEVHNYENCYDNEIFNMFTQEEQYTELLKPIPEPHQVPQNDNNVISEVSSVEQSEGPVEQHPVNVEETHALYDSLYNNLEIKVDKINTVNHKLSETNAELTTELARYKNQERCFEISQEKYDKLERCYQKSVYQEQCLSKKINALHLSSEKKKLKSDFKIREDELLDKKIQLEKRIKELDNILVKTGQSIQMIHMLSHKPDSFYHTEQKMDLGYQNPFYLKQAQQKQQSLYDGKVLLKSMILLLCMIRKRHCSLLKSRQKMKQLNKEIKPANYTKINHFSGGFVSQMAKSREELYFSNTSKTANVSKTISIPNEEFSDDTTPSVTRKFLNEVKSTIVTLQCIVKQRMTLETHNRVQNFEIQVLKEAAKFVRDFKSLAKEADESLAKHKALELEIERLLRAVVGETHALLKPITSNSIPTPQGSKVVKNDKVIAPGMFRINPFKPSREEKHVPNKVRASIRTKPIPVSQPPVITKKVVNSDSNGFSSTGVDNTKTKRPQPRSNTKNDRVPSTSKSSRSKNTEVEVEEHHRKLLLSRNKKHMSSECNNVKLATHNVKSKVVCAMSKETKPKVKKTKKVGFIERLASPNPSKHRSFLRWSPTGRLFDLKGKIIASSESKSQSDCSKSDNACTSNPLEPTIKRFPNSTFSLAGNSNMFMYLRTVRFGNDHAAAIIGFGDIQWGNILITRVYFVERLGYNFFSVGKFCDSDLEVTFRRNTCFIRNLEGIDTLSGNQTTNLYTINLYEMAFASPICLMARALSTKSWLWNQRLSHLNFDTINDLAKNDLVSGKSKRASHPPKPVPNSRQRLHLLHMDLCGPMRIASINRKRYVVVIVDDYSRYTWVHFLRSKDEALEVIKTFLKRITIILQSPVIIIRTDNDTEFKNQALKEYFDSVGISCQMSSVRTPQQNRVVELRNRTLVEAARTMLIFSRASLFLWVKVIATTCFTQNRSIIHRLFNKTPYELINGRKQDISFLHVFGALCYPKIDREDIGKLGAKGDIGFFIGYSADSCAFRVYNRRTKKIIKTMNVSFDRLSAMSFEQSSSKPELQSMNSGQISSGVDLTYALSTITTQQPTEGELDLLFEAMCDDYIGGQPSYAQRTVTAAQAHQVRQTLTTSTSIADINVKEDMTDPAWIESMQEELLQFKRLDVWVLVPAPNNITPLTLKWLFKNKHDEEQTVIQNKSRLVVRGYRQEEGIDFKESFTPLKKALYGLKQAPRAWYDELSTFLLQNHFFKGTTDPTLFIRPDILHATCLCARYQAKPTEKHLKGVKRIFCYLRGTVNMGHWYMKDSGFELTGFSDADYAGCKDTFKSTFGGA